MSIKHVVTILEAVDILNRALEKDREAITALFMDHRVPCNKVLCEDETSSIFHLREKGYDIKNWVKDDLRVYGVSGGPGSWEVSVGDCAGGERLYGSGSHLMEAIKHLFSLENRNIPTDIIGAYVDMLNRGLFNWMAALRELQCLGVNFSISCFFDEGFRVKLGDELNGYYAEIVSYRLEAALWCLLVLAYERIEANVAEKIED